MAGATEYKVIPEAVITATEDAPKSYTACHNHGTDTHGQPFRITFLNANYLLVTAWNRVPTARSNWSILKPLLPRAPTQQKLLHPKLPPSPTATFHLTLCKPRRWEPLLRTKVLTCTTRFCSASSTEYYVQTSVTATGDVPAQFTGCHSHGEDT